jgi:hypothetical protein
MKRKNQGSRLVLGGEGLAGGEYKKKKERKRGVSRVVLL